MFSKSTFILVVLASLALIGGITFYFNNFRGLAPIPVSTSMVTPILTSTIGLDLSNLIRLEEPKSGQSVKSPLVVSGQARGNWYFEASFPVKILDANGVELGVVPAQAQGEWMTENFVGFKAVLYFKKPSTATGTLVLKKDNPSGLAQNDAELRIPVKFDLANWPISSGVCKPTGCSGQLCVDEAEGQVVTTCEYKAEYSCYKTAKCERQEDGKCGWTPSEELVTCLSQAFQAEGAPQ